MKTTFKKTFGGLEKTLILAIAFMIVANSTGFLLDQSNGFCDVAAAIILLVYLFIAFRVLRTKISFTYEKLTGRDAESDDLDQAKDQADNPLYMHPSHKPYHNAKIGGRLCEMCGTHASSRRAKEWCTEVPPPKRSMRL